MQKLWFKRKWYGWGWYPATWEGWLVLLGFIVLLAINSWVFSATTPTASDAVWFVGFNALLVAVLIGICFKTGESPRWQWGPPKDDGNNSNNQK